MPLIDKHSTDTGDEPIEIAWGIVAEPAALVGLHAGLAELERAMTERGWGAGGRDWWNQFVTACVEIVTNSIRHAYPAEAVQPKVQLDFRAGPTCIQAIILDWGQPFPGNLANLSPPDPLAEGGLGLLIAQRALDLFEYTRLDSGKNQWTLKKMISP